MIEAIIHVNNRTGHLDRAVQSAVSSARACTCEVLVRVSSNASNIVAADAAREVAEHYQIQFTHTTAQSAFAHFKATTEAAQSEFVALLHDDDFVGLAYFEVLHRLTLKHPKGVAWAPDAHFLVGDSLHHAKTRASYSFRISPKLLALLYLLGRSGPPFPSILYNRNFALAAFSSQRIFGKYSDAPIVMEAAREGLWIDPEMAFTYVIGEQNDSRFVDIDSRRKLKRWLWHQLLSPVRSYTGYSASNLFYFSGRFLKCRSTPPMHAPPNA